MSRLLATVTGDTFNRLIRILEINLGEFDPDNIRQIDDAEKSKLGFNAGSIVWNTNNESLEVWSGSEWITVSPPQNPHGLSATGSVGEVTLNLNGATTITL